MALNLAIQFATTFHAKHVDRAGKPYIEHCRRVADRCQSEEAKAVAWLHDTIEHGANWRDILSLFGHDIAWPVTLLSREPRRNYFDYILLTSYHPIAREVKIADLLDNSNLERLPYITCADLKRQWKYLKALAILLQ